MYYDKTAQTVDFLLSFAPLRSIPLPSVTKDLYKYYFILKCNICQPLFLPFLDKRDSKKRSRGEILVY